MYEPELVDFHTSTDAVGGSARVNSLEARMDEQSAVIASLAQGMHEMLQQMRQLRCDTMAASSAPRDASAADAPTSAEPRATRSNRAGESSRTPTVEAHPASETTPTVTFTTTAADGGGRRATPHVRDPPGTLEARTT
eukprot:5282358-Pleurochrysis_carterae.AAC.1